VGTDAVPSAHDLAAGSGRRWLRGLVLVTSLFGSGPLAAAPLEAAAPAETPPADTEPVSWYAIPNVAYDSDDQLGFGARAEIAWRAEGYEPYKRSLVFQGYTSVTGFHHHRIRLDRVGLGVRHRLRLTTHLAWRQWKNDGYWGVGNGTVRERAFVGSFEREDPARRRYRYSLLQPFAQVCLRQRLGEDGPWSVYGALNPKWSAVQAYAGSLLEEDAPFGMDGGLGLQVLGGVVYDTRDPEIVPNGGVMLELGGRGTPDLGGEAGGFGGPFASARGFQSAGDRVVFAGRVVGEWLLGSVPFYEMVHWGGQVPMQGFGGFETLRGVRFGRWRAPGKAVANAEVRVRVATHPAGKSTLGWELAPFADLGTVWGANEGATASAPDNPVHPAVGAGLRVIFDEVFVGRIDAGLGWDPVLETDGGITQVPSAGIYMVFDHPY
jgi:hypothetical protein